MLKAPFPYFGGKSRIAELVWSRLGDVKNYVEPFFGSGAILLARPAEHTGRIETVNDIDGFVANFWRAVQHDPAAVAKHADNPVNECDLHARHSWLVQQRFVEHLMGDPDWYDAKIAGWWVWGTCAWIGHGFASGAGPWTSVDGYLVNAKTEQGMPELGNAGRGINKQLPHCGNAGQGINKQLPHCGNAGRGINNSKTNMTRNEFILQWMQLLAERLRNVRVCCGDWSRVCGNSPLRVGLPCAIVLDPPYSVSNRSAVYSHESFEVSHEVRKFAVEKGEDTSLRIALFGYEGEHEMPASWECVPWKTAGGFESQSKTKTEAEKNCRKERVWFSPGCLKPNSQELLLG